MIKANICRNEINKRIGRLERVFAWGVENELVPASVLFRPIEAWTESGKKRSRVIYKNVNYCREAAKDLFVHSRQAAKAFRAQISNCSTFYRQRAELWTLKRRM